MPATLDVRIDSFRPEHQAAFATLNRAWLLHYNLLEPADESQLDDPVGQIIGRGGQIFVAQRGNEVVGTCAVIPHEPGVLELAKLVVAPTARGQGLGRRLIEKCVAFARERDAIRLVLVSNSQLGSALRLYEEIGFQRRPLPPDTTYVTVDVYMELELSS